ncbi:MAG: hypothetical protein QX198_15620 [Methylococcaceae bacterium]
MNLIIKVAMMLMLVSVVGCDTDDKPIKAVDTGLLKTQREALEQAKQVEQGLKDAAEQQRQKIERETQ